MDVSCEAKVREVCRSLSGWHVAYDKVVFSHHYCSCCILTHWSYKLKEAEVGVKCWKQLISVLLYEDEAVILAEEEKLMRWGLEVLMDWCDEWAVEINVEKSGIMHMRKKGMKRTVGRFYVGGKKVGVMEEYKYLGSVVNEYLNNVRMVEERGGGGAKALSYWLRKCRAVAYTPCLLLSLHATFQLQFPTPLSLLSTWPSLSYIGHLQSIHTHRDLYIFPSINPLIISNFDFPLALPPSNLLLLSAIPCLSIYSCSTFFAVI